METTAILNCMVLAAQLSEKKPFWLDENGRDEPWGSLGGSLANWIDPFGDVNRYGEHNRLDTLSES